MCQQAQQQAGSARAGVGEVDMWIGVIDRKTVDLPQHAVGEDAVKIEGDDDGDVGAREAADFLEDPAFGV
jgi:hypothetical protein